MGAWGTGPFDNDEALDLFLDVEDATPEQAAHRLIEALRVVADEEDSFLESPAANEAVAAAAVVAYGCSDTDLTGNPRVGQWLSERAPRFGAEAGVLAARALDRVCGEHSEWPELWADAGLELEARAAAQRLQLALVPAEPV